MGINLIIFDLDGTLADSLLDLTDAVNRMRGAFALEPLLAAEVREMVGKGARELVRRALGGEPSPEELGRGLALFLSCNEERIAVHTALYPGVRETLKALRREGRRFAVVSNKNEALCRRLLEVLEVEEEFEAVMGADSHAERKPLPGPLLAMMERLGVSAGETAVVGDSINDIAAGKAAGVITIGCSYGYGDFREIADADYRVASFPELADLPVLRD